MIRDYSLWIKISFNPPLSPYFNAFTCSKASTSVKGKMRQRTDSSPPGFRNAIEALHIEMSPRALPGQVLMSQE